MRNLKLLGFAAVAATALMAFAASSASATALYNGSGTKLGKGAIIDFSIPSGSSAKLVDTENEPIDTCTISTVKGELENEHTGKITVLSWEKCTFTTTTKTPGKLEVVSTGGTTGEVQADATIEVTIDTVFFGSCVYGVTAGSRVGTLAGSPAVFTGNAIAERFTGSNISCPTTAKWTGTYNATEPPGFHVEEK